MCVSSKRGIDERGNKQYSINSATLAMYSKVNKDIEFSLFSKTESKFQPIAAFLTPPCFHISVGQTAQLTANPRVEARCGQNVTMTCDVNIQDPRRINLFQWITKNETCKHRENRTGAKFVCQSEEKRLSLTVLNVMPGDQGDYLCKLRSETGAKSHKTVLVIPSAYKRKRKLRTSNDLFQNWDFQFRH